MASFTKIPARNKQGYKWICVKDAPPDPITGIRQQIRRRGDTKKEAEAKVDIVINEMLGQGSMKPPKNLTFEDTANDWYDLYSKTGVKESTLKIRRNSMDVLFKYFRKVKIITITRSMYQKVLNKLFDEDYERSSLILYNSAAKMIFEHAVTNNWIKENPQKGAVVPMKRLTVEEIENSSLDDEYLETQELKDFLNAVMTHGLKFDKSIFFLLAFSGLRPGELCALGWVDLEKNRVRVTKTLYTEKNNMRDYKLTPPKTEGSVRNFDIDFAIVTILDEHRVAQNKSKELMIKLDEYLHDGNFIFCNENGYPLNQSFILRRMKRLLSIAGITKEVTPHSFRHTHISMLTEAGVPLPIIMKRVGHDDPKTTIRIYTHVTQKMQQKTVESVNDHFSELIQLGLSQNT
ncbi:tyrosine-type recombinase/integrase [Paenibacillus sp. NRS-1760]|uniref:tyrosine-type recombinase/integrase n=1 Tax=Paenibacillus sp. NRS-1760 TaxID=3233902 RepID=UPI003D2BD42F